jgi:ADP-L-glycero-D-manno-heptose 6-epimerase
MKKKSEKIVVTGGAGFIGSGVLKHLNDLGYQNLYVIDDLGTGEKWRNLVGKTFVDVISKHVFFDWLKGKEKEIQAFIHLGACSSTVETDAAYLLENNTRFSMRLAEYAFTHGQRFIYASSAATYGDGAQGFLDHHDELEKLSPLNMYGFSKHLFDLWLKNQGCLDKVVGLKYFNVFGPNENHKGRMASTIFHFTPQVLKEGKIKLFKSSEPDKFGDGDQVRDFVYVKDVARMTCAFLDNEDTGIYNMGSGQANTWNTLAKSVFKALNKPVRIEYVEMPHDLKGKYQNYTKAEMAKTHKVLKTHAEGIPFEDSVIDYVGNYLVHDKRW